MINYVYFVSYSHERGFGNIEITQDFEMTKIKHIRGVEQAIKDKGEVMHPLVMNYQLLRTLDS